MLRLLMVRRLPEKFFRSSSFVDREKPIELFLRPAYPRTPIENFFSGNLVAQNAHLLGMYIRLRPNDMVRFFAAPETWTPNWSLKE